MPSPTPRTALDPIVPPLTSPDVPNMLKNMKPPAFKGEERERSKDAVNTFLHKWSDFHALRRTPNNICALETSLSLEGKAYKWWMSLKMANRPTSWTRFQEVFRKEFLPENEPDRNWAAWDKCRMDKLTLTQYISKYCEIILKLEGLDDFQKVRGFLRGLNDEYKTKVKTQYPKTLEDAIKSAQIFDDSLDKASSMSAWGKSALEGSSFKNGKRKSDSTSKEDGFKKPKGAKGPLTSEELARARREKLCFQCLGSHERKDCPQLKGNAPDRNKGKETDMHTVQLLPLSDCSKYLAVQVCHQALEHECCLTDAPWQQT
ncbi:hypothetical protein L7F22_045534 [Adiantum nelumboides]|nr:hypothetical protein [Adiantum nelumboides]